MLSQQAHTERESGDVKEPQRNDKEVTNRDQHITNLDEDYELFDPTNIIM